MKIKMSVLLTVLNRQKRMGGNKYRPNTGVYDRTFSSSLQNSLIRDNTSSFTSPKSGIFIFV